jgi:hypothetical protein
MSDYRRSPTRAEKKKWASFVQLADRLNTESLIGGLHIRQYTIMMDFARDHNVQIASIAAEQKMQISIREGVQRLKKWISLVEHGTLGLSFDRGDINIVAPPGTNEDEIAKYQFGGWFIFLAGVLIVGAIVAYTAQLRQQTRMLAERVEQIRHDAGSKFCSDKNSPICHAWLKRARERDYVDNESTIDKIKRNLTEAGQIIKTGFRGGLVLLIPVLAIWALYSGSKK